MKQTYKSVVSGRKLTVDTNVDVSLGCEFCIVYEDGLVDIIVSAADAQKIVQQLCASYGFEVRYTPPKEGTYEVVQV
jgi:hypothetical protein